MNDDHPTSGADGATTRQLNAWKEIADYRLNADLRLIRAEWDDRYPAVYDRLVRSGTLPGTYPRDRVGKVIPPILRWNGSRFAPQ